MLMCLPGGPPKRGRPTRVSGREGSRTVGDHELSVSARCRREPGRCVAKPDERGQATSEYVVTAGVLAAIIVVLFSGLFRDAMKDAATSIVEKLRSSVAGMRID